MRNSLEIIISGQVGKIFRLFSSFFGIIGVFTTPEPKEVPIPGAPWKCSRFCRLLQERLDFGPKCSALDERRRQEAARKGRMISYRCHSGLLECIIPIFIEKRLIGFFVIGQIRCENEMRADIKEQWDGKNDPGELEKAFAELPYVPAEKVGYLLDLFDILIQYVTSQQMVALKGNLALEKVMDHINSHLHEPIALPQAARLVGKSPSTISHLFAKQFGKPFKQVVIEAKLRKFEEILKGGPSATVREAAEKVGFADPYYFSRLYKKYRGAPPSSAKQPNGNL